MSPFIKPWFTLCLMSMPSGLVFAFFSAQNSLEYFPLVGVFVAIAPMIGLSCTFFVLLGGDRDRIYSENYQMARGFMSHAEQKDDIAESKEALNLFMSKRENGEAKK